MNQEPIINNQGAAPASTGEINTEQDAIERAAVKQAELVNYEKNKANKGLLFGLILCLILAIGGIGFGVYEMIDGNAKVDKLNKQNNALQVQNNELAEKLAALQGEGKDNADYIISGELGIKIKKPVKEENKKYMISAYTFYEGYPQAVDYLEIREDSAPGAAVWVFVGDELCDTSENSQYSTCFAIDNKNVFVRVPMGETAPNAGIYPAASEDFLNHFFNSENYSSI